ncbi:MAG: dNTP triphosphohydrolase [Acidobacteria bacterium]|nr:dNTP triphosphohydrolase [Acidobacteriota bacterium]
MARLRYPVNALRGRRYPEPPHPYRNEFQRDRDRIVHARAFRRLEDKTQVFGERLSDHFRNRLTHTIEVSQIARTLASALGLDEDFTEALALAHDIGHPPFGHAGEDELDRCMRAHGDFFDHNLHALRIVEDFELRYARFPGLNLTFEVREGMVKHSRDFGPGEWVEFDEYLPGLRPPLEAQLIDLADEVAYNTADLDDAYTAGMFTVEEISAAVPRYGELVDEMGRQFPGAPQRAVFQEVLRRLIDLLVSGVIQGTMHRAQASGVENVEEVRRQSGRLVTMSDPARAANLALKSFLTERVYSTASLAEERRLASEGIGRLFGYFMEHPAQLPEAHRERIGTHPAHRVVCDYIAGMTDGFFRRTAERLLG